MAKRWWSPLRIPASTKGSADSVSRQKFSKVSRARRLPIKLTARTGGSPTCQEYDCSRRMHDGGGQIRLAAARHMVVGKFYLLGR